MANKTIRMITLKQLIRLKAEGLSNRQVSKYLGVTRRTVNKYVYRIEERQLQYKELLLYEEGQLQELFTSSKNESEQDRLQTLSSWMPYVDKELKRVGVTRWSLWAEYRNKHPEGYAYTRFCIEYQQWKREQDVAMHIDHKAGDKMYVDFAGKKLSIVNAQTGEETQVEVFVAVLGASQLTYVEACGSQKKEDFITALENALHYFEGVPAAIVPDNLKSAVTKSSKYEPKINETLEDFAHHYSTVILPTRAGKPKDKALVEGAVNIVYNRIFSPLRNTVFFSLPELNEAIAEELEKYNTIHFKGKDHSRRDLFAQVEKSQLKPLPQERYELKKFQWLTVLKISHIWINEDKHYYSVPYKYIGQKVKVIYTHTTVEVYCHAERIAFHKRNRHEYKYSTVKEHMPSAHNFVSEWQPEKFLSWADSIGEATRQVVENILQSRPHPEQAYKSCVGILGFARRVGNERLNNACNRAIYYQSFSYNSIKNILDKGLDRQKIQEEPQFVLPLHENIRGREYYR
jgi:transposase